MAGARLSGVASPFQRAQTPFSHGRLRSIGPAYSLLTRAAAVIPSGASVVPVTEPRNPAAETNFYRAAVGLMPHQRVLPAARWGQPSPSYEQEAQYLIVLGKISLLPDAELILRTAEGAVWRRRKR